MMQKVASAWVVLIGAAALLPNVAHGQTSDAGALYGQGVHAYFSGNSSQAESHLSSALARNPDDPRLYYFRGLALMRQGRGDEARGDMMVGARLEADQPGRYAIGRALERVQGSERLQLEQFRRQARTDAQNQRLQRQRTRYQQTSFPDERVLRRRVTVSLDEFLPGAGPRLSAAGPSASEPRPIVPSDALQPITVGPALQPSTSSVPAATEGDPFLDDPASEREQHATTQLIPSERETAEPAGASSDTEAADEDVESGMVTEFDADDPVADEEAADNESETTSNETQNGEPALEAEAEDPFAIE